MAPSDQLNGGVTRPLLSLVMIVKDEARSIEATIASVRPYIDTFLILDTGSTDGTVELARRAVGDLPGEIHCEPFVNYGATRSRALELAGERSVFTLMLSGDETLVNGEALRHFCEAHRTANGPEHEAYLVRMQWGSISLYLPRLVRSGCGWFYTGVTHEYLTKPNARPALRRVPAASVFHDLAHADHDRKRRTWERDLELLSSELRKNPTDTRSAFYRAQTLEDLHRFDEALAAFRERAAMGGFVEEVFQSLYRMAKTAQAAGRSWPEVQQLYLDAHAHSPHRAEPLYAIAAFWLSRNQMALAYLFASRGLEIPLPPGDVLCVEDAVYEHLLADIVGAAAFYLGKWDEGEAALGKALRARPNDPRLLDNLQHYILRRISGIEGWFSEEETRLLVYATSVVARANPNSVLVEVGSYCGRSTVALASVLRAFGSKGRVYAVDPHQGDVGAEGAHLERTAPTFERFQRNIAAANLTELVTPLRQRSTEVDWTRPIDLLFVDGLHDYENVSADYLHFEPHLRPGATVAFHDCTEGWPGVRRFVDECLSSGRLIRLGQAGSLAVLQRPT